MFRNTESMSTRLGMEGCVPLKKVGTDVSLGRGHLSPHLNGEKDQSHEEQRTVFHTASAHAGRCWGPAASAQGGLCGSQGGKCLSAKRLNSLITVRNWLKEGTSRSKETC